MLQCGVAELTRPRLSGCEAAEASLRHRPTFSIIHPFRLSFHSASVRADSKCARYCIVALFSYCIYCSYQPFLSPVLIHSVPLVRVRSVARYKPP